MNRTIRQITENLTGLLPDNRQYYKPEELHSWGFPSFIVRRIQVELKRNLAESMRLPETDWANMQSNTVQTIWQQFIAAIRNEAWLPASYAQTVIETAVADVLEILIQPRKNIPEVVFGAEESLTEEQLQERVHVLVVYTHFAHLLPRYMKKKGMDELSKEQCSGIVAKADAKIIDRYTPLNWAQMLEPLFTLSNGQIDSSLLRLFFEDKKMPKIARAFDLMDQTINRAKLIETLSSPESMNVPGFEEEEPGLFDDNDPSVEPEATEEVEPLVGEEPEREEAANSLADSWIVEYKKKEEAEPETENENDTADPDEQEAIPLSNKSRESRMEVQHDEPLLYSDFEEYNEEEAVSEIREEQPAEETGTSLNDNFENPESESYSNGIDDQAGKEEEPLEETVEEDEESDSDEVEELSEENLDFTEAEKEETPMWQRFMSTDEILEEDSPVEENAEDGFIEEPIFDIREDDVANEQNLSILRETLESERAYFVDKIFKGSEKAYDEALEEIASKKEWRNASRFIEKEVFQRNFIDLYSEEAVEFTDRLHNFFIDHSES